MKKHAVITGSTKGIGFGLAKEFLKLGYTVTISGTTNESLSSGLAKLKDEFSPESFNGSVCNVREPGEIESLWETALSKFGKVDVWINSAGINQPDLLFSKLQDREILRVIETNLTGLMIATRRIFNKMEEQGFGEIYNMEGFGSDGRKMKKMALYGSTKCAVRYFTESFVMETEESPVLVGTLSPGMVLTNLLLEPVRKNPEEHGDTIKIYNILADEVETVTPYLAKKVHLNKKHGAKISWLGKGKVFFRFLTSAINRRKIVEKYLVS